MNSTFPQTSVTLIAKIRDLGPGRDSAEWVRFWDSYSLAIKQFAIFKGGKENADDIVMTVLAKLVDVLRNGQYTPEKGAGDRKVSLDAGGGGGDDEQDGTLADTLAAPDTSPESLDEDWRNAVLKSATEHVLTKTALSERDRAVYRAYVVEGRPIEEVSAEFRISRNMVSQIKTRIERRIVAVGRELVAGMERM